MRLISRSNLQSSASSYLPTCLARSSCADAPTQFQDIGGVSLAYRHFGKEGAPPGVCFQHFTGTINNFDPIHTNHLAQDRPGKFLMYVLLAGSLGLFGIGGCSVGVKRGVQGYSDRFESLRRSVQIMLMETRTARFRLMRSRHL
jgi:hypothetical protein